MLGTFIVLSPAQSQVLPVETDLAGTQLVLKDAINVFISNVFYRILEDSPSIGYLETLA